MMKIYDMIELKKKLIKDISDEILLKKNIIKDIW